MKDNSIICFNFYSYKTMQDHEQISKEVDEALELFRYLPAKDIFEAFYNKRLARRLLMNLSYSYELEKRVLDRLRTGMLVYTKTNNLSLIIFLILLSLIRMW